MEIISLRDNFPWKKKSKGKSSLKDDFPLKKLILQKIKNQN